MLNYWTNREIVRFVYSVHNYKEWKCVQFLCNYCCYCCDVWSSGEKRMRFVCFVCLLIFIYSARGQQPSEQQTQSTTF
jgi:hypothetical protein